MNAKTINSSGKNRGFTLIELLTVIAIIGILAAILIPTVGAARTSAKKASSKVFLNQLLTALEAYKSEYGYYPSQLASSTNDEGCIIKLSDNATSIELIKALSGRNPDGSTLSADDMNALNPKGLSFFSFAQSNFYYNNNTDTYDDTQLVDSFNNTNIFIIMDTNANGVIISDGPSDNKDTSATIHASLGAYVNGDGKQEATYATFTYSTTSTSK